jgi:hypothetical protein
MISTCPPMLDFHRRTVMGNIMTICNANSPGRHTHTVSQTSSPSAHSEVQVFCLLPPAPPALELTSKQLLSSVEIVT